LSVALILDTKFEDEDFLLSLDATKINQAIVEHYQARAQRTLSRDVINARD